LPSFFSSESSEDEVVKDKEIDLAFVIISRKTYNFVGKAKKPRANYSQVAGKKPRTVRTPYQEVHSAY
jgi:hypothetical protein